MRLKQNLKDILKRTVLHFVSMKIRIRKVTFHHNGFNFLDYLKIKHIIVFMLCIEHIKFLLCLIYSRSE